MNTSRLLIAAAYSLTVIGASSVAFAQTTTPGTSNSDALNQNQNQAQSADRMSNPTAPGSTNPRASDTDATGTTGSRMGQSTDDTMRRSADDSTMRTERLARADRN